MAVVTNKSGIPLALAVWLLHDDYDFVKADKYISVTTLMKPIRQIILGARVTPEDNPLDVEDLIPSALGKTIHAGIEKAWAQENARKALRRLGSPESVIDRVVVNPATPEEAEGKIPVYLEQRAFREFKGWTIGGKFDMVTEGIVNDTKSTSAYAWVYGTRDEEHQLQGSLYRWIDAGQKFRKITEDHIQVNYVFTDWQKILAKSNPNYPDKRVKDKSIPLLSLDETSAWIENRLDIIDRLRDAPEYQLPECTDEELWRSEPKYKYFSDPTKTNGRSTKNFPSLSEANAYMAGKGKGIVITEPGEVKRCGYCSAFEKCTQKDRYFND